MKGGKKKKTNNSGVVKNIMKTVKRAVGGIIFYITLGPEKVTMVVFP